MPTAATAWPETAPNTSGRPNRVAPDGTLVAASDRGMVWGNRGPLLDEGGKVVRHSAGLGWVICRLEFNGRHREQWRPGRLTELYFLDEPTALAAGHRPCGECRHADHLRFKAAWAAGHPGEGVDARTIDRHLHADRIAAPGRHRTHEAALDGLPDGVVVQHEGRFWLVRGRWLHAWSFAGYRERRRRSGMPARVVVQTPRATVAVLLAGFEPAWHPSLAGSG